MEYQRSLARKKVSYVMVAKNVGFDNVSMARNYVASCVSCSAQNRNTVPDIGFLFCAWQLMQLAT